MISPTRIQAAVTRTNSAPILMEFLAVTIGKDVDPPFHFCAETGHAKMVPEPGYTFRLRRLFGKEYVVWD